MTAMCNVTESPTSDRDQHSASQSVRPLIYIDLEGSGVDPVLDRITSIGMLNGETGAEYRQLVNPCRKQSVEVIEKTGLTDEMLKDQPVFGEVMAAALEFLGDADIAGFNLWQYDLPLFSEECGRVGRVFEWRNRCIIDCGNLFKMKEPRTLEAAVEFYCGRKHVDAHTAMGDVVGTRDVLQGQLSRYSDLSKMTRDELHAFTQFEPRVDLAGKLSRNTKGEIVYNFGKSKGVPVLQDIGFAQWMLSKDFTADTKAVISSILAEHRRSQKDQEFPF